MYNLHYNESNGWIVIIVDYQLARRQVAVWTISSCEGALSRSVLTKSRTPTDPGVAEEGTHGLARGGTYVVRRVGWVASPYLASLAGFHSSLTCAVFPNACATWRPRLPTLARDYVPVSVVGCTGCKGGRGRRARVFPLLADVEIA